MRILRIVLAVLVVVALVFVGGAYLMPRHVIIERETVIDAPPEQVFPYLNSLQRSTEWSPWIARASDVDLVFSGPEEGVGNTMAWTSEDPQVGNGRQEIVVSEENSEVRSNLDFGEMGTALAWLVVDAEGDGSRVVWGLDVDMGNSPIGRWLGLKMDDWVGTDYEDGLARLKALVEGGGG
ncbi:hypothetical protein HKCCE2091_01975 [Rhodobacterales bacterium HKCCE2091]|nr:hypothetical protein [Rhodobacterales bacterium HKCCE2091]